LRGSRRWAVHSADAPALSQSRGFTTVTTVESKTALVCAGQAP
jgi:hypothetical protein